MKLTSNIPRELRSLRSNRGSQRTPTCSLRSLESSCHDKLYVDSLSFHLSINLAYSIPGTGIGYGYDYCVSIPGFKPTYTSYVFPTPTRASSMKVADVGATDSAFAMTDGGSSSSDVITATVSGGASSTALASASTSAIHPHMHKHKRAPHQH